MERLAWTEHGDPDGFPVFFLHGTPGSRLGHQRLGPAASARGVRVVCPDRAGVGRAARVADRPTLADSADDLAALADHLGCDRFAVVGYSGGGAYALAAAARLPDRVTAVGLLAAAGPCECDLDGVSVEDRIVCWLSVRWPRAAGWVLRGAYWSSRLAPRAALRSLRRSLGDADRAVIDRDGLAVMESFREAFRQGPRGVVDDYRLSAQPWGFALGDVSVPVHVWHGSDDRVVPVHHAVTLAEQLPDASLVVLPDDGHLSILDWFGALLDSLLAPAHTVSADISFASRSVDSMHSSTIE